MERIKWNDKTKHPILGYKYLNQPKPKGELTQNRNRLSRERVFNYRTPLE